MDHRQLRYFVAAYEEGSISAAAKRLYVAQPSVSVAIAQIEERVGARLFERHRHGVTATLEAKAFYARAVQVLGDFKTLSEMFSKPAEPVSLSLAIMPAIDASRIASFLKLLIQRIERLKLRLVTLDEPAEARIVSDRLLRKEDRFVHLWNEKYVLALPQGHPLTRKTKIALSDLNGVRMIERCHCELHDEASSALARRGVGPDIVARVQNEEWALAMAAAGVGVALVPEGSIRDTAGVVGRAIERFSLARRVGLAYAPGASPSSGLHAAVELCREVRRTGPRIPWGSGGPAVAPNQPAASARPAGKAIAARPPGVVPA